MCLQYAGHLLLDSQDGAGLEVFLIHPFGLAYLQDLCVAQVLQATLELVQGIRLDSQRSHDLLPHHLHYLQRRRGRGGHGEIITDADYTQFGQKLLSSQKSYYFFQNWSQ